MTAPRIIWKSVPVCLSTLAFPKIKTWSYFPKTSMLSHTASHIARACIFAGNFSIVKRFEALPTYDVMENCPAIHVALL